MNMFEYLEEYMGQTYSDKQSATVDEAGEPSVQENRVSEDSDSGEMGGLSATQGLEDGGGNNE